MEIENQVIEPKITFINEHNSQYHYREQLWWTNFQVSVNKEQM